MIRSLHTKLVLILILLIVALMTVVGAFLINGVNRFYLKDFVQQMDDAFGSSQQLSVDLQRVAAANDAAQQMASILDKYSGLLGIESRQRDYMVLDGVNGRYLAGSNDELGGSYTPSPNVLKALTGERGDRAELSASYIDFAVPISDEEQAFVVVVHDSRVRLQNLTMQLFTIILESVLFGLVISILLSYLLSRTMTKPIESLTERARRLSEGDFSERLEVPSGDELGILTQTFNNMAGVLRDTLEAVGRERDKLGTLFLHMTDGVIAHDWEGKLLHINPAAIAMLQVRPEDDNSYQHLLGDLVPLAELRQVAHPDFIRQDMTRDGRSYTLLLAPFGDSGTEGGVMAVMHDITEQKRLDDMRREFVANVSHELRTPLTNIKSYAETLSDTPDLPGETIASFSQVIVGETDRMTRIVQDLLTLSRMDYGKMEWQPQLFDYGSAVKRVFEAMQMQAKQNDHTLTLEVPDKLPQLYGDRERLEQVLVNIISNAIKYTPSGGSIHIEVSKSRGMLKTTVTDTGIGIPKEDIPRLFERFYRVDKARSRESGGTGLGLSIAKEIVEQHGGRIQIRSMVKVGTMVTIVLPIEQLPEDQS